MISQRLLFFRIRPVNEVRQLVALDPSDGPFPAESAVSPALHEAARRRLPEVELALRVVVGAQTVFAAEPSEDERVVWIRERGEQRAFGLHVDNPEPEQDEPSQLERDIDMIADELSESTSLWARRLPECPTHPDSHPLLVSVTSEAVVLRCPLDDRIVRTVDR